MVRLSAPESLAQPVYAELHCHSAFSFGDGASTPEQLAERAAVLGYPALALTDHDEMGGQVRHARACEVAGIRPVHGAELTLEDGSHLTLLVESEAGWRNLCRLVTRARTEHPRGEPRTPDDVLAAHSEGLIALSGCPRGRLPTLLAQERYDEADRALGWFQDLFGDRLYLEVHDHRTHAEASLFADLADLSRASGVPWLVAHDVHYADPAGRRVHDLLVALRHRTTLADAERRGLLRPSGDWHLQPQAEMARRWARHPDALRRTLEVAERCAVGFRLLDLRPAPPGFALPEGHLTADGYLAQLAWAGLAERLPAHGVRHHAQLAHELAVIAQLGIADHFLVVWDLCAYARAQGILCQGRGSAANSLVCYALRVTNVDPVASDLLFERFVSEERPEPPDIDIDFAADEARERVIQYVYQKYGRSHAAMVCTSVEYRGRSALRDAMRGLGFTASQANGLAGRLDGHVGAGSAAEWLETETGAAALGAFGLGLAEPRARALVKLVRGMAGLPRHRGIHSGGFVLSREPIGDLVPVEWAAMAGRTVLQWDKDCCADMGLAKFDLLGLGMLRLLGECTEHVRRRRREPFDLGMIPLNDSAVYAQVTAADTVGLFQIESRAQANFLPRLRPTGFYDLVISVGAIRPGPMLGGQVKEMLARRRGDAPTEYPHPTLEPVLARTHGLALFQEQLMQCAVAVSGCSPGQADALRRAMSRKRSSAEMQRATAAIREGMRTRGVDADAAERVLGWLEACASYTFPESHAISFALLAYASAWLRLHYPAEYLCSILNAQPMGFYPVSTLIHDARAHGVEVRPVDLVQSAWDSTLEPCEGSRDPAVRLGLRRVRGLGAHARTRLQHALRHGPFLSIEEMIHRAQVGDAELRALAAAGAFRSLVSGGPREALWAVLAELRARRTGGPLAPVRPSRTSLPALSPVDATLVAHHTTGADLEGHPMRHLRAWLADLGVEPIAELRRSGRRHGEQVTAAGLVIVRQRPSTAKGFVFIGLEDETARLDVIITPALYGKEREVINGSGILAVRGQLGVEDGVTNLRAKRFFPLRFGDAEEIVRSHDYH